MSFLTGNNIIYGVRLCNVVLPWKETMHVNVCNLVLLLAGALHCNGRKLEEAEDFKCIFVGNVF